MSWQRALARALGKPGIEPENPIPKIPTILRIPSKHNCGNIENIEDKVLALKNSKSLTTLPAPLTPALVQEVLSWQGPLAEMFCAALNRFEEKGYPLTQAESLAYATVKVLNQGHGGPVGIPAPQDQPRELAEYVAMVSEVFGPAVMQVQ